VKQLIVHADDYGLTGGINRAVVELHSAGVLTSASLMAGAARFPQAVELAKAHPSLGVGCHVVLVDGSPVAEPASVASLLTGRSGRRTSNQGSSAAFRPTLGEFLRDLYLGRIQLADMEREAVAQIRRIQNAGLTVTHLDTHKHTHMFPPVLQALARAATVCGVHAIRNPFEPAWSAAATQKAGLARRLQVSALARLQPGFLRAARAAKLVTTDGCLGVLATGTLDAETLQSILDRMPEGTWELVCHPAYLDDELRAARTRLLASREVELAALQSMANWLQRSDGPSLLHFGQLGQAATWTGSGAFRQPGASTLGAQGDPTL
jgi:predicted glycoside hydrolase/deacetylase ChbG (UPF0249 family)